MLLCVLALYLIYRLRRPITWIFIAGFIAIALSGPVAFLQRRMRRGAAVAGQRVVRFTWRELTERPAAVKRTLHALLA